MDSSIEEDEEEFFETLEDIASSSSGTESGDEEKYSQKVHHGSSNPLSNPSPSRYEMWKNSPGSILERRQRLRAQMGLNTKVHGAASTVVPVPFASPSPPHLSEADGIKPDLNSPVSNVEAVKPKHVTVDENVAAVMERKDTPSAQNGRLAWTMVRSRSDGTFSRLPDSNGREDSFLRLVKSGTTSPALQHTPSETKRDRVSSVTRTVSHGHGQQFSKPPLGGKKGGASLAGISCAEGLVARRSNSYWNMFGRFRITDKHGNSLFESRCLDGDSTPEGSSKNGTQSVGSNDDAENPDDGEFLCRIKDLDSGKEFVVNEVGKDGMWNKLKELDTGKEITLEEFESSLGLSPIVQEVLRRERAEDVNHAAGIDVAAGSGVQKRKGWLKAIKGVVKGSREKGSHHGSGSDDKDASTEKSGRRSGSATDDSQDASLVSRPVKVHAYKKPLKSFSGLRLRQEIQAHQGAIWTIKFSLDGTYLASAGQDKIVKVWEVFEQNFRERDSPDTSGELGQTVSAQHSEVKRTGKNSDDISCVPKLFMLSESPKCSFRGHTEDVLDLSWSSSQLLLSSSMDKTVRLWNISSKGCLKIFPHNDYVTCIQFHPLDDGRFISGSLDGKVRIWSIKEPQVVDWVDLREMVTAACYTPNGQGALIGSYKGTCRLYKTSGNKLQLDTTFEVRRNKSRRSQGKKITGFQFIPQDKEKVLITSSDSRIRVYDGTEISSKYKGFRNTKSHISASLSLNGEYIICASEDSRVYIWNYSEPKLEIPAQKRKSTGSYEYFSAKNVLVAISWPGFGSLPIRLNSGEEIVSVKSGSSSTHKKVASYSRTTLVSGDYSPISVSSNLSDFDSSLDCEALSIHRRSTSDCTPFKCEPDSADICFTKSYPSVVHDTRKDGKEMSVAAPLMLDSYLEDCCGTTILSNCVPSQHVGDNGFFSDNRVCATWPEEKLSLVKQSLTRRIVDSNVSLSTHEEDSNDKRIAAAKTAWGFVIVTASSGGEIRTFQNYSLPVRL